MEVKKPRPPTPVTAVGVPGIGNYLDTAVPGKKKQISRRKRISLQGAQSLCDTLSQHRLKAIKLAYD